MESGKKKCPYCSEYILKEASKCRFCGEWLTRKDETKRNHALSVLAVVFFIVLAPIAVVYASQRHTQNLNQERPSKVPEESIFELINKYRTENKKETFLYDEESCLVAKRVSKQSTVTGIEERDYIDLCPTCNSVGLNLSEDMSTPTKIMESWKNNDSTRNNLLSDKKYACDVSDGKRVVLIMASKRIHPIPTSVPVASTYPRAVTPQPTIEAKERKKVSFTTTEGIVNGTYYCFEDRVNELTNFESNIKVMTVTADSCSSAKQFEVNTCTQQKCSATDPNWSPDWAKSCIDGCYKILDECLPKHEAVGNKRKEYVNLIREICP